MKIPYKFNPLGISKEEGIPTRGLDFYLPLEENLNDAINGYTPTTDGAGFKIERDTNSTMDKYGRFYSSNIISVSSINRAVRYLNTQSLFQYGTGNFTIAFWLQAPSLKNARANCIFAKKGSTGVEGMQVVANNTTYMTLVTKTASLNTDTAQNTKWVHWLYERKDGVGYWYKNGVLNSYGANTDDVTHYDPNSSDISQLIIFGWNGQYSACQPDINLKSFRVYNRALTASEINALANEFDVKYKVYANDQTFRFTPVSKTYTIEYESVSTVQSFEIISGELPNTISFNTSTGTFSGSSLTDSQHTYNLVIRMTGYDITTKEINVTINTEPVSDLAIQSQTFNFITEKEQNQQILITREENNINCGISNGILPNGVSFIQDGQNNFYLYSTGNQNISSNAQITLSANSQYHPEPVYETVYVGVSLNQISANDLQFIVYSDDEGARTKRIQYTTENPISAVYTLNGTLPAGFSFDSESGIFSYDGTTLTPASGNVEVTISSATGHSSTATINALLQYTEQVRPWEAPSGSAFYASLSSTTTTAETGDTLTFNDTGITAQTINGIPCLYFPGGRNQYISAPDTNMLFEADLNTTFSIWMYTSTVVNAWIGVFGYGRETNYSKAMIVTGDAGQGQNAPIEFDYSNKAYNTNVASYGTWHHVCVTAKRSGGSYTYTNIYIDGVAKVENQSFISAIVRHHQRNIILIGQNASSSSYYQYVAQKAFIGYLAAARIYNRILTPAEIATLSQEFTPTV